MAIGFIGCGTITAAIVSGLGAADHNEKIIISPRNAANAARLASRFANVEIGRSNQCVVDAADLVVLAVRPKVMEDVLAELRFRPENRLLSLVAGTSLARLKQLAEPCQHIVRAVPIPPVALCAGPTAIYPHDEAIVHLFDRLGTSIVLDDEDQFDLFTVSTATMSAHFAFTGVVTSWMERRGVAADKARHFMNMMMRGLADAASAASGASFSELADEYQTRGGLNEQVRTHLEENGHYAAFADALDAIETRLERAR